MKRAARRQVAAGSFRLDELKSSNVELGSFCCRSASALNSTDRPAAATGAGRKGVGIRLVSPFVQGSGV